MAPWLAALLALALALAAACSGGDASTPTATPTTPVVSTATPEATPAVTATRPAVATRPFPPEAAQQLQEILNRTAEIRGLQPRGEVDMKLIGREDAATYLRAAIKDMDRRVIALHEEVYGLLGLIPEDADLLQLEIDLLQALVLGFYDPDVKAFFVLEDLGATSAASRSTAAHELTHALQDQYYDLNAISARLEKDWDATAAFIDLVEGDARATENTYTSRFFTGGDFAEMLRTFARLPASTVNIPQVVRRELDTPYTDGLRFVQAVSSRLPQGVDALFARLPTTTSQILHPEKYLDGVGARPVDLLSLEVALGPGWRTLGQSNLGEFTVQSLLLLGLSDGGRVRAAAAGWAGDQWLLYGKDDGARVLQYTVMWDDAGQARELWSALVASLGGREAGGLAVSGDSLVWRSDGKVTRAALVGDTVTLVVSNREEASLAAAGALGLP